MAPGKGSARGAAAVFDLFASCPCSGAACLQLFRWGSVPSSSDGRAFDHRILNLYGSTWIRRVFRVAAFAGPSLWPLRSLHVLASNPSPASCFHSIARPARVVASSEARGAAVLWAVVCVCMRGQQCRWRPSFSPLHLTSSLLFCSGLRTLPLFPAVAAAGQSSSPPSLHSLRRHRAMPACRRAPRKRRYSSAVSRRQQ